MKLEIYLAERTQKSLIEINATINVIIQSIVTTSDRISVNAKEIEKLSEDASSAQTEISNSSNLMGNAVIKVNNMVNGYLNNGEAVQKMINKVEIINDLSSSNTQSVEEITAASEHLSEMTLKLNNLLALYKS